jgi:hypothetical protein
LDLIIATAGWNGWYFWAQTRSTQPITHPYSPYHLSFVLFCSIQFYNVQDLVENWKGLWSIVKPGKRGTQSFVFF